MNNSSNKDSEDQFSSILAGAFVTAAAAFLVVAGVYVWKFRGFPISSSPEHWGQLGDYFGGLVNPVVGLITVFLVVLSIAIQRRELKATVDEMKISNEASHRLAFEQSLFAWLGSYQGLLAAISDGEGLTGRRALAAIYKRNFSDYVAIRRVGIERGWIPEDVDDDELDGLIAETRHGALQSQEARDSWELVFQNAVKGYKDIERGAANDFDVAMRTLFRLLRWVDAADFDQDVRWHYIALIRAQLSFSELVFVMYNTLAKPSSGFSGIINKYALFDNLEKSSDQLVGAVAEEFNLQPAADFLDSSWPFSDTAFSSDLAKSRLAIPLHA